MLKLCKSSRHELNIRYFSLICITFNRETIVHFYKIVVSLFNNILENFVRKNLFLMNIVSTFQKRRVFSSNLVIDKKFDFHPISDQKLKIIS